jgi:16S rRNA (adenine1518-N6/adenine1519-N6)-dimethyltransferase
MMRKVTPKKRLGQHFLKDENIAKKIVDAYVGPERVIEVGPGMGVLTKYLLEKPELDTWVAEIDTESVQYLQEHYPALTPQIVSDDFLKLRLEEKMGDGPFGVIGNFPYNISSQIFFKVLDYRNQVDEVVGMIQREVALRIASDKGNKVYGILSVFLQAFYKVEYLFTVNPGVFIPPPKVKSAVLRLKRNDRENLGCDEKLFFRVVKQGFNNRRKTLRNALKPLNLAPEVNALEVLNMRAEQLGVDEFIELTKQIECSSN